MYSSIVELHLTYCYSVWGCCGDTKVNTLQKLQNRAAKIVKSRTFDLSAAPLLQGLGWLSVDKSVHRETANVVCKSLNGLAPDNLAKIFSRLSDVHNRVLRNIKCDLAIPRMRTAYGQRSLAFRGADAWNKLHCDIKLAPPMQSFKAKISKAHKIQGNLVLYLLFSFPFYVVRFCFQTLAVNPVSCTTSCSLVIFFWWPLSLRHMQ